MNNHLVDWLNIHNRNNKKEYKGNGLSFRSFLQQKGIDFENGVIEYLSRRYTGTRLNVTHNISMDVNNTLVELKRGTPLIYSGTVFNTRNKTYGITDILVRSDYMNRIFNNDILTSEEERIGCKFSDDYHYRVIDVKYKSLKLASDGIHLNNYSGMRAYKSQVYIYNQALSNLQEYNPNKAYILGRRWKYSKRGRTFSGDSCFSRLGTVNFNDYDKYIPSSTTRGVKWYRDVINRGKFWSVNPPTRKELYPNMCVDSGKWNDYKRELAKDMGDITLLWKCGKRNREKAMKNNIKSFYNEECNSNRIGFQEDSSVGRVVDNMIKINRDVDDIILPRKISTNYGGWKDRSREIFVDFETISDICENFSSLPIQSSYNRIFMIGVGWNDDGCWRYRSFIARDNSRNDELNAIRRFIQFYMTMGRPKIYYWHAEQSFWNSSIRNSRIQKDVVNTWIDMSQIFKQEPIVIKDCYSYSIKEIARKMREFGMINTYNSGQCDNGMTAMIRAHRTYKNDDNPTEGKEILDIERYNEYDCRLMHDIIGYLREYHI